MRTLVLVVWALVATGCTLDTDYFGEYRGKNILSNYGLDAVETDGTTAKWALEAPDASLTTSLTVTASTFMNWTKASSDSALVALGTGYTLGPDGTSPAYRVEIKNLIPNGDFADTTVTSLTTPWTATGGTATWGTTLSSQTMTGRAMQWTANNTSDVLSLDLTDAVEAETSLSGWPMKDTNYQFRADYLNLQNNEVHLYRYLASSQATDWSPDASTTTYLTKITLSKTFLVSSTETSSTQTFRVGNGNAQPSMLFDNVKLVPDIATLWVKASLPLLGSGSITLLPGSKAGMYVFTLKVRDDPTVATSDGLNRLVPSAVTVRLKAKVKSGSGSSVTVFPRPSAGWTSWTTLTVNTGFDFVTSDSALSGDALTVEISPTNTSTDSVDAGAVLIAQPTLTFNP